MLFQAKRPSTAIDLFFAIICFSIIGWLLLYIYNTFVPFDVSPIMFAVVAILSMVTLMLSIGIVRLFTTTQNKVRSWRMNQKSMLSFKENAVLWKLSVKFSLFLTHPYQNFSAIAIICPSIVDKAATTAATIYLKNG